MVPEGLIKDIARQRPQTSQAVVVQNSNPASSQALLVTIEKEGNAWRVAAGPFRAMTGREGFAPAGGKREGDGRTPAGIFSLDFVFGYGKTAETKMPYVQMTAEDIWVDDPDASDYNRLAKKGRTSARSFEEMRRADDRYKYGIVVGYNTNPVVPGHGSAIFVHIWKDSETATAGCVALAEEDIIEIIRWLDPVKKPVIVLGK